MVQIDNWSHKKTPQVWSKQEETLDDVFCCQYVSLVFTGIKYEIQAANTWERNERLKEDTKANVRLMSEIFELHLQPLKHATVSYILPVEPKTSALVSRQESYRQEQSTRGE